MEMDPKKYEIPQALDKDEELFAGFIMADFVPLMASIVVAGLFRVFLLIVPGAIIMVYLRLTRIRHPRGYISHLLYRWIGFGGVPGRIPPGDRISPVLWE